MLLKKVYKFYIELFEFINIISHLHLIIFLVTLHLPIRKAQMRMIFSKVKIATVSFTECTLVTNQLSNPSKSFASNTEQLNIDFCFDLLQLKMPSILQISL